VSGTIIPDGKTTESKPVFRVGANYQAAPFTFFRGSWGQGYRYPTIAEKFIRTDFGGVIIAPNPGLESETGWTAELGIKQGFKLGGLQGFADFSIFQSRYQNMLEFSFLDLFRTGFQSLNVGDTQINGFELSMGGRGQLFGGTTSFIGGYTYIDPEFANWDTSPIPAGELGTQAQRNVALGTSDVNVLKYRNRHSAKLDLETQWGNFSFGVAGIYNSRIENIDLVFEAFIVPELDDFRAQETGYLVASARTAYRFGELVKLSLLLDNATNEAYATRPGLLAAPRSVALRLDVKW
jgi:iron complex outermembrane receptor protein